MFNCKNRKATKPLNKHAVNEANRVQPSVNNYHERKKWLDAYINAGGNWECVDPKNEKPNEICSNCNTNQNNEMEYILTRIILGIRFQLQHFKIKNRKVEVALPFVTNKNNLNLDNFHNTCNPSPNFDQQAKPGNCPDPNIIYKSQSAGFHNDFYRMNYFEKIGNDYKQTNNKENGFNNSLTYPIAIYIKQDKTFKHEGSGNFYCEEVEKDNDELIPTEKMAMVIHVFVKMNLDGKKGTYEFSNNGILTKTNFNEKSKMEQPDAIIPGVQQYHILIEENSNSFFLKEVYCDGGKIF